MEKPALAARLTTAIATVVAIVVSAAPALAQKSFDITLEVEPIVQGASPTRGAPGGPRLAFTGAPLWFLGIVAAVLLAVGIALVLVARNADTVPGEA